YELIWCLEFRRVLFRSRVTLGRGRALHTRRLLRSKLGRALCVTLDVTFRRGRVLHPRRLLRPELRCALCVTLRRGLALHPRSAQIGRASCRERGENHDV